MSCTKTKKGVLECHVGKENEEIRLFFLIFFFKTKLRIYFMSVVEKSLFSSLVGPISGRCESTMETIGAN